MARTTTAMVTKMMMMMMKWHCDALGDNVGSAESSSEHDDTRQLPVTRLHWGENIIISIVNTTVIVSIIAIINFVIVLMFAIGKYKVIQVSTDHF